MTAPLRHTPLHAEHVRAGGKLVPFNGWEMPLQYAGGILREHEAVRRAAGLFDVSHMARFELRGLGAVELVDSLVTNDVGKLAPGRLLYTPICREDGGVLDDVTVYRFPDRLWIVVNAGNRERIAEWIADRLRAWKGPRAEFVDRSESVAQIAFQGPRANAILAPHVEGDLEAVRYYGFLESKLFGLDGVVISRNGYTGEDGFEIYAPAAGVAGLWSSILGADPDATVQPAGLGCRDTLRLEMGYCLYGNELDLDVSPLEARLQWTVKLGKETPFVGREALLAQKTRGLARTLVGFRVDGQRLARKDQALFVRGAEASAPPVGRVTSGGFGPSVGSGLGLGFVSTAHSAVGTLLEADVRGSRAPAEVVELPFYRDATHR